MKSAQWDAGLHGADKFIQLLFGIFLGEAVALLQQAEHLISLAGRGGEVGIDLAIATAGARAGDRGAAEGKGDHILAARFLSRFVPKEIAWLHLDLAAGSRHGGLAHIATEITGFGVRYTLDLVRRGWPPAPSPGAVRPAAASRK